MAALIASTPLFNDVDLLKYGKGVPDKIARNVTPDIETYLDSFVTQGYVMLDLATNKTFDPSHAREVIVRGYESTFPKNHGPAWEQEFTKAFTAFMHEQMEKYPDLQGKTGRFSLTDDQLKVVLSAARPAGSASSSPRRNGNEPVLTGIHNLIGKASKDSKFRGAIVQDFSAGKIYFGAIFGSWRQLARLFREEIGRDFQINYGATELIGRLNATPGSAIQADCFYDAQPYFDRGGTPGFRAEDLPGGAVAPAAPAPVAAAPAALPVAEVEDDEDLPDFGTPLAAAAPPLDDLDFDLPDDEPVDTLDLTPEDVYDAATSGSDDEDDDWAPLRPPPLPADELEEITNLFGPRTV